MSIRAINDVWVIETQSTAYVLGLSPSGLLLHLYWGARLPRLEDYPQPEEPGFWAFNGPGHMAREEYPAHGGIKFVEPCLKVRFADGVRDTLLVFESAEIVEGVLPELTVRLKDAHYPLTVSLHYRAHPEEDLLERWVALENQGEALEIERVWSAQWHMPAQEQYFLHHLSGRWLDEFHLQREPLGPGTKIIESRRLTTSHSHSPWFAVERGLATEDQGEVWFGALAWSGNWKLAAEVTEIQQTRVSMGLNDWDFAWRLGPGERFTTPACLAGFTREGFGGASRRFHQYVRGKVIPHGKSVHKVLYNSWEATTFDVDEASQARLAEIAAGMGVELFVMDDGWFHGRNDDHAGLGDWWPDEAKFPTGLGGLIHTVNRLGMQFGLWVEPEMVNPDSELYRAHPDWVIHFPTRARSESRNQLILNLARTDVQDYLIERLDQILSENNIAFIKWDMNRNVSEPGWPEAPGDARELWVRYVQGVYRVWGTLRDRHPQVVWQSCSGGGGRADLGILRLADQVWVSDNTDAPARLHIQEGFSQVFPAITMEAWVTDAGRGSVPLEFRFHVSMCGSLGVGGNLLEWDEAERDTAAQCIALYKEIRHVVQLGQQYRLRSPQGNGVSAVQYVSEDRAESVLFAFRVFNPVPFAQPILYPRGLESEALYERLDFGDVRSGAGWMETGLTVMLPNLGSQVVRFRKVG